MSFRDKHLAYRHLSPTGLLAALLILLLTACSLGTTWVDYESKELGIRFAYPDDWTVEMGPLGLEVRAPDRAVVIIGPFPLDASAGPFHGSPSEMLASLDYQSPPELADEQPIKAYALGDYDAASKWVQIEYELHAPKGFVEPAPTFPPGYFDAEIIAVQHGGQQLLIYLVNAHPIGSFDRTDPILHRIAQSIEFYAP